MKPLLEKVQRQLFLSLSWPHKPPTCTYREDCLSIVIPALNEAACIENTIHLIWERSALYLPSANADRRQSIHQASSSPSTIRYVEVIVVDGGSSDETLLQACRGAPWWHAAHLRVTRLPPLARPARANQMNYGASIAQGAYLMFLHADTVLPWSYPQIVYRTLQQTGHPSGGDSVPNTRTVGAFSLSFPPALPLLRLVAWGANVRAKLLRQPYGDQAYFMRRGVHPTSASTFRLEARHRRRARAPANERAAVRALGRRPRGAAESVHPGGAFLWHRLQHAGDVVSGDAARRASAECPAESGGTEPIASGSARSPMSLGAACIARRLPLR
eukprot:ctg_129.g97